MKLTVLGMDPSLNNWGLAVGTYDLASKQLDILELQVTQPDIPEGKQVRNNSKDLARAEQLSLAVRAICHDYAIQATFVEVPTGSQTARAMASYGVCVGILGDLRATGYPFYEVTPLEVKKVATGRTTATKREMIQWAYDQHPSAPWPFQTKKGVTTIIESKAEHMADAVAAIHAGIRLPQFQQLLTMMGTPTTIL